MITYELWDTKKWRGYFRTTETIKGNHLAILDLKTNKTLLFAIKQQITSLSPTEYNVKTVIDVSRKSQRQISILNDFS